MELKSLKDTQKLAKKISKTIKTDDIIFLYGEIGVGKTTFVKFLINYLEKRYKIKESDVLSPTFNLVFDYTIGKFKILHYDLYRLKNKRDILELGIFEVLEKHIKIIEWPHLIKPKPKDRIEILLKYSKNMLSRKAKIIAFGKCKNYLFNEI